MPARASRAAVEDYLDRMRAVASCVTDRPIIASGYRPSVQPYQLSFAPLREPAPLRAGGRRFHLDLDQAYRVSETSARTVQVVTVAYRYHLLDRQGAEIVAFHWHPESTSPVGYPHLHLTSRIGTIDLHDGRKPLSLAAMHMTTGMMSLADIVRLLIAEFGVEPRRTDWQRVLSVSQSTGDR